MTSGVHGGIRAIARSWLDATARWRPPVIGGLLLALTHAIGRAYDFGAAEKLLSSEEGAG